MDPPIISANHQIHHAVHLHCYNYYCGFRMKGISLDCDVIFFSAAEKFHFAAFAARSSLAAAEFQAGAEKKIAVLGFHTIINNFLRIRILQSKNNTKNPYMHQSARKSSGCALAGYFSANKSHSFGSKSPCLAHC